MSEKSSLEISIGDRVVNDNADTAQVHYDKEVDSASATAGTDIGGLSHPIIIDSESEGDESHDDIDISGSAEVLNDAGPTEPVLVTPDLNVEQTEHVSSTSDLHQTISEGALNTLSVDSTTESAASAIAPPSVEPPVMSPNHDDEIEIAFPFPNDLAASPASQKKTTRPSMIDLSNISYTEPRSRASSRLASPGMNRSRSRTNTVGSMDSRASGTIDDKSYFSGPDDKLVSRLANKFENGGDEKVKTRPRRKSQSRKKLDTSFLNEENNKSNTKNKAAPHALLRKSSTEFLKKQIAQQPDAPPPMPGLPTGLSAAWSGEKLKSPTSPTSISSVHSLSPRSLRHEFISSDLKTETKLEDHTSHKDDSDEAPTFVYTGQNFLSSEKESIIGQGSQDAVTSPKRDVSLSSKEETKTLLNHLPEDDDNLIFGVCVVGFHHARGPEVEYWVGPGEDKSTLWPYLAFQCLPDGSHSHEENFCYFTLLFDEDKKIAPNPTPHRDEEGHIIEESDFGSVITLFGISCNRQIKTADLKVKTADVTRSIVQKSVVVIARKPIFGPIKEKLAVVTRAYFGQGDFGDRSLVDNFHGNLRLTFKKDVDEGELTVGMPLRELIHRLGYRVLVILKALLLERRVLFFASNTELLCASQFSIISLIPNLINHLEDSGSPLLSTYETKLEKPTSLKTSDRNSLLSYMGLPLQIFAAGGLFNPYVPLQQIDELKADETKYFLVGTTNSLFMEPKAVATDVVVNMDTDTVTLHDDEEQAMNVSDKKLSTLLALSSMDKKWMDHICKAVNDTWDPENPWRPKDNGFYGTEDYIRMQFEDYMLHLLASVKYDEFLRKGGRLPPVHKRENLIKHYNEHWVNAWRNTNNHRIFQKFTDTELFDIVEPKHLASFPPGSSTILGLPAEPQGTTAREGISKGVSRIFGGLWTNPNNSDPDALVDSQKEDTLKNRLSMSSIKSTLSKNSLIKSPTSSSGNLADGEEPVIVPATGQHASTHASKLPVSTVSSTSSASHLSSNETVSSKAGAYFAGWSQWANTKRRQLAESRSGAKQGKETKETKETKEDEDVASEEDAVPGSS